MEQSKQQKSEGEVNHVSKEIQRNKARQKEEKKQKKKDMKKRGGKNSIRRENEGQPNWILPNQKKDLCRGKTPSVNGLWRRTTRIGAHDGSLINSS